MLVTDNVTNVRLRPRLLTTKLIAREAANHKKRIRQSSTTYARMVKPSFSYFSYS